ncbi:unnamed protein product [Sphagnum jensenii]|uniref:DUF7953 domain-containing protein n=1 Tax=Sphagnum jensenii TaxID=128206 RepID=A0ABP0W2E9_9BRYO
MLLFPGVVADGDVRLASLVLYRTHEWFGQPTVYFHCLGEQKVFLPDVIQKDFVYDFIGQESWQPLTFLEGAKCKRCGFYEEDKLKYDDRFDEWELCPTEFTLEPDGRYIHFNKDEFNATFVCPGCRMYESEDEDLYDPPHVKRKSFLLLILLVLAAAILVVTGLALLAYMYWRRKQHEAHQARFMELFEDDESLQADLGLKEDL